MGDVADVLISELRIPQTRDGVVFVQPLERLGRRLDMPLDQRPMQRSRDLHREQGLAGARFALHQEWTLQRHRRIDREHQIGGRDVSFRAFKTHRCSLGSAQMHA